LGEATKLDALAIEAQVKEVELNMEKAKNGLTSAFNRLKLMLKIDWRTSLEIAGDIEKDFEFKSLDASITDEYLVSLALKNRKEVESTDVEYLIGRKNYEMSENYYYPKLSLGLNYSYTGEEYMPRDRGWGVNFEVSSLLWGNSGSLSAGYNQDKNGNSRTFSNSESVNVLDSMSYKRSILENTVNYKAAKEKKRSIRQEIALEVTNTLSALSDSWKMIGISRKQLELYDSFLEIERLKANMGESRRYDLVKKELERGEAAISYLNSLISYLVSASSLELSVGVDVGFFQLSRMKSRRINE
jgi:outer membrane protein TolC